MYSYSQTERVFFYDLSNKDRINQSESFTDYTDLPIVTSGKWGYANNSNFILSSTSSNQYFLSFNDYVEDSGSKYFAIKQNVKNGKYKLQSRIQIQYEEDDVVKFFYCKGDPKTTEKIYISEDIIPVGGRINRLADLYESNSFEITDAENGADYYFGVSIISAEYPDWGILLYFGDFELVKTIEPTVSYDEICKPTASNGGNKRYQTKGEILNANNLDENSPLEFTPTGSSSNQAWANNDNFILAEPGATFDIKVTYEDAWGSLTVFQLRSDKTPGSEDKIFGTYEGSWYSGVPGTNELYTNIAKDTESGIKASQEDKTVTCPITIPSDIRNGELVIIRFIVCKTADGATYDGTPCATDATELNYCDYIIQVVNGQAVAKTYPVTVSESITNGKVSLKVDGEEVSGEVEEGKTVTVEVTPDKYYELATLTYKVGADGEEQDIKESKSFNVSGETVVNATFSKISYTITYEQPENGSIKVMNDNVEVISGDKVEAGTELTVEATPNGGYELAELKAGENDILQDKSFIVEDNTTITARFALPKCTLTYTINGGEWVADITIKDIEGNTINSGDKVEYGSKYIVRAEKKNESNAVNIKVNDEQVIANVSGKVYTYEGTVEGDTHITIDLFSDISSVNAETVYYDSTAQTLYTGTARTVKVYDLSGRLVLSAENQETVSLSTLENGIYTIVTENCTLKIRR